MKKAGKKGISIILAILVVLSLNTTAFASEEKPFEEYGSFTDAADDNQVRQRADWYYRTYIADPNKINTGAKFFYVEQIMDDIRIMNGEFMRKAAEKASWNEVDVIAMANDLHTIANYDSFTQYGTQIFFTPTAPLFVDGSAAQKDALAIDSAMEKTVAAIRAMDDEAFVSAAREWGMIVVNIFDHVDMTGEYVSVHQVGAAEGFALYHAMSSKYASTILEYSEARNLNVTVPCSGVQEAGGMREESLSQIIYRLNETPVDAVALQTGHFPEYANDNLSLPQDLCLLAKDYFNSKYYWENFVGGTGESGTVSVETARPGVADLEAIGSGIEYPRADEYLESYVYAVVKAPKGHSVYGYGSADRAGRVYTVLDGEQVMILAERKGMSCCIVLSSQVARWINTEYLERTVAT